MKILGELRIVKEMGLVGKSNGTGYERKKADHSMLQKKTTRRQISLTESMTSSPLIFICIERHYIL